jgi:hypothetical protein
MAEAVATAAAVLQFLDVAVRLSSVLVKLYSDVRDVPERFRVLNTDLQQQITLVKDLQTNQVPAVAALVASPAFEALLQQYVTTADDLCTTLKKLLGGPNDGRLQRAWNGLCATRKKAEITGLCDRLEQHKSALAVWLGGANL